MTHFQVLGFRIHALARLGRTDEAIAIGEQALQRARESGALQAVPAIELALATAELLHGALDSAADRANGLLRMPHLHTLVLARETLARIALARDQPEIERCARLAAAGASTRARLSCAPALGTTGRLDTARTQLTANGASDGWDARASHRLAKGARGPTRPARGSGR